MPLIDSPISIGTEDGGVLETEGSDILIAEQSTQTETQAISSMRFSPNYSKGEGLGYGYRVSAGMSYGYGSGTRLPYNYNNGG